MTVFAVGAPFAEGRLKVSARHTLYYAQHGNPKGAPAVVLHGGPGAGSTPEMAGVFAQDQWRVLRFDQRGCGQSRPHAELRENTTWDLVDDMEKLRRRLGIKKWLVCGGSWGSALALAYAQTHPQRVSGLILRGVFTLRRAELLWFYQEGASWIFPELWEKFIAPIPVAERGDIISAYHRRLTGADAKERLRCAKAWSGWEAATLSLHREAKRETVFTKDKFALAFARIENHYFVNAGFFAEDGWLLKNAARLRAIPGAIIHGRYDIVTPIQTAWRLHRAWPRAKWRAVHAGHAATEKEIAAAMAEEIARLHPTAKRAR